MRSARANARLVKRALATGTVVALGIACYGATEVRLTFVTDLPCSSTLRMRVTVEDEEIETLPSACRPGEGGNYLGSLVVVPRGDREARVRIQATLARSNRNPKLDCALFPEDCVVGSRAFHFFEHETRNITVRLDEACLNVRACTAGQTCDRGTCVSEDVDAPTPQLDPSVDAGPNATPPNATDGTTSSGCLGPAGDELLVADEPEPREGRIVANARTLFWVRPSPNAGPIAVRDKTPTASLVVSATSALSVAPVSDGVFGIVPGAFFHASGPGLDTKKSCPHVSLLSNPRGIAVDATAASWRFFSVNDFGGSMIALGFEHPFDDRQCSPNQYTGHSSFAIGPPTGGDASLLELGHGFLYGLAVDKVIRVPRDDGSANAVTVASGVTAFALGPAHVHVAEKATLSTDIVTREATTLTKAVAASNRGPVVAMAASGGALYWVEQYNPGLATIWRTEAPTVPGAPVRVTPPSKTFTTIRGLVVDEACVYFWGVPTAGPPGIYVMPKIAP